MLNSTLDQARTPIRGRSSADGTPIRRGAGSTTGKRTLKVAP